MKYKIFSSIWEKWILSNFLLLFLQPLRTITRFTTLLLQNIARPKSESKSNFIPNHHLLLVISSISSQKSFDSPYYKLRKSFNSSLPPLSHANFLNYIPYIKSKFILWHHWSKWLNPYHPEKKFLDTHLKLPPLSCRVIFMPYSVRDVYLMLLLLIFMQWESCYTLHAFVV